MDEPTLQDWADYKEALDTYRGEVDDYINHFSENPQTPRPPRPPKFEGWLNES